MYEYSITLKQPALFWLGCRFFKAECKAGRYSHDTKKDFVSMCPSCNDTRKIKYIGCDKNEYEAECPVCKGFSGRGYGNRITLRNWEVHEYIVYKINAQGPNTLSAYKDGMGYIDSISLTAFCKTGRSMDDYIETHVPCVDNDIDRDIETIDMKYAAEDAYAGEYVFRNKKDAERFCEALKEYDRKRLNEFNKTYNTEHEYPY